VRNNFAASAEEGEWGQKLSRFAVKSEMPSIRNVRVNAEKEGY
jgi:hypothetical protein